MTHEEFEARVEELEKQAYDLTHEDRVYCVSALTEEYVLEHGEQPSPALLDRLSDVIMHDDLTDPRPNKSRLVEYNVLSDNQYARRTAGTRTGRSKKTGVSNREVSIDAAANVDANGMNRSPSKRRFDNPF